MRYLFPLESSSIRFAASGWDISIWTCFLDITPYCNCSIFVRTSKRVTSVWSNCFLNSCALSEVKLLVCIFYTIDSLFKGIFCIRSWVIYTRIYVSFYSFYFFCCQIYFIEENFTKIVSDFFIKLFSKVRIKVYIPAE